MAATPRIRPGDLLIHPVAVLAVVVLVINDHVLKSTFPGLVTGKLSDVAGLVFFPLLLASVVEFAALARRRTPPNRRRLVVGSMVATGLMFVVVKTTVVGSMAFGWSLGLAQWLAGAGPLRGVAPMPAGVAVDPGDLVALAGLIGAWFVARGPQGAELRPRLDRAGRPPSRRATAMLVVASLATMATGGANVRGQQAMVTWGESIHLDDDHPAAVRHLSYDIDMRGQTATSIYLSPEIHPVWVPIAANPSMTMTVMPDEPVTGPQQVDLTKACQPACHGGATVIVRLTSPAPNGVDPFLYGALIALTDSNTPKFGPSLALRSDDAPAYIGSPAWQVVKTQGKFHVTAAKPKAKQRLEVRIDAAALKAPLAYPLVATVESYIQTTDIERSSMGAGSLTVGKRGMPIYTGLPYTSTSLLSMCKPATTCVIPIQISAEYSDNLTVADPPAKQSTGSADLVWRIRVRLEAFDGRTLPADAVSITKQ